MTSFTSSRSWVAWVYSQIGYQHQHHHPQPTTSWTQASLQLASSSPCPLTNPLHLGGESRPISQLTGKPVNRRAISSPVHMITKKAYHRIKKINRSSVSTANCERWNYVFKYLKNYTISKYIKLVANFIKSLWLCIHFIVQQKKKLKKHIEKLSTSLTDLFLSGISYRLPLFL